MKVTTKQLVAISGAKIERFHFLELADILGVSMENSKKIKNGDNVFIEMSRIQAIDTCGKLAETSYWNCPRPLGTFRTKQYNARNEHGYSSDRARKAFPV